MQIFIAYIAALISMFLVDLVWLGVISKKFYSRYIGGLMADPIVWPAAILFYLFYTVGVVYFAIIPAIRADSWLVALSHGALFGFMCYMTYDLTNWAVLRGWAWQIVAVDILWGMLLTGGVAVIGFYVAKLFN